MFSSNKLANCRGAGQIGLTFGCCVEKIRLWQIFPLNQGREFRSVWLPLERGRSRCVWLGENMRRACFAGMMLALSASTALADPIAFDTPYIFETSSATPAAPGTTVTPPSGGLGNVGGLCEPGTTGCPAVVPHFADEVGPLTGGFIEVTTPSLPFVSQFALTFAVSDDGNGATATGYPPKTVGDIFQITLNGHSLGVTSVTGVTSSTYSTGEFTVIVGPGTYTIGITDLLEPYAKGLTDTLPGVLCSGGFADGDPACTSPPNGGTVAAGTFGTNILDFEASFFVPVPEPASFGLLGCGLIALAGLRRRAR